ncbi:tRNA-dihydrouridine synthase C [Klebsiella variicola]|uniref:tRNA-dihydrouridine synthase C n=1 Tax=Klebsiella variicola TaxID=244366 RepID=A0A7H4MNY9_KLEVA|nr:tRNA-dihydrouridine synthase C [Klebsiella variicola]
MRVQQAGASELVVHGRTKEDGYKAERINWQAIGEIRQRLTIPVVANGEIWDWQSAQDCMAVTGCDSVMIGRGALNVPNLSRGDQIQRTAHAVAAGGSAVAKIYPPGKAGRHRSVSCGEN